MKRIFYLAQKEFIHTFRDKRMVGIIFVAPIIQLLLFGYAVTLDVTSAHFGVWDRDNSQASRELVLSFEHTQQFRNQGAIASEAELEKFFNNTRGDFVIVIEPGFSKDMKAGKTSQVQILFDGSDSNYASQLSGVSAGIINKYNTERIGEAAASILIRKQFASQAADPQGAQQASMAGVNLTPFNPSIRVWYNPDLESEVFMVPAIVCVLLLVVTLILTTMAVTREKEVGTMEHIIVTPITSYQFILGKMAPFVVIGFVDVTLIVVASKLIFDIPLRGSLGLLYFASLIYLFTTLGLGLLFSTISKTQQQAMFLTFMFLMPAILLSGFIFPISNMPDAIQLFTYANPLRYFLVIIRGIFLKGTGIVVLWDQFLALTVLGLAIFLLAVSRFNKTLE